jgi:hypothetical protein
MYHVTSVLNRDSILTHGLDPSRMAAAPGIAGSEQPDGEGCFVCLDEGEVEWFVAMNNTGGPVDVWAIDDVDEADLVQHPDGHSYYPEPIPASRLRLLRRDVRAAPSSQR